MKARLLLRNADAGEFVEDFLVFAVAAILGFRIVLHLTGYPSLGGTTLHIAHMLPGGLLMLVALLLLLGYLGSGIKRVAAIVGGAGFGMFIDELGKFVTRDNDYFFKPTAALIYLLFILTWLAFRATRKPPLSREESVANALELMVEAVRHDLDRDEKARALALIREGSDGDPAVQALEEAIGRIQAIEVPAPGPMARLKGRMREAYAKVIRRPHFAGAVVTFFVAWSVVTLVRAGIVARGWITLPQLSFFQWGEIVASTIPGLIVLAGVVRLRRSRLAAYELFQRAVLFQIFVTEFFSFYHAEFLAAAGLLVHLIVFVTLRYMIHQETAVRAGGQSLSTGVGTPVAA